MDISHSTGIQLTLTAREIKLIGLALAQVKPLRGQDLADARALNLRILEHRERLLSADLAAVRRAREVASGVAVEIEAEAE